MINDADADRPAPRSSAKRGRTAAASSAAQVDKYSWVDLGSSYLPSELLAAILHAQLERREEIQGKRRRLWERYRSRLG